MKLFFALIASGTLIFFLSCNSRPSHSVTEMEFQVDSSIVNKMVTDSALSISYAVPGDWIEIETNDSTMKRLGAANVRLSKLLKNSAGSVVFSLSDVSRVADSTFSNMSENYKTVLNPTSSWTNVEKASFTTKGYDVDQFVMSRQGQTFFKMLFGKGNHRLFQVDYSIIVDSSYARNTKTLESIIGSLHRDH